MENFEKIPISRIPEKGIYEPLFDRTPPGVNNITLNIESLQDIRMFKLSEMKTHRRAMRTIREELRSQVEQRFQQALLSQNVGGRQADGNRNDR